MDAIIKSLKKTKLSINCLFLLIFTFISIGLPQNNVQYSIYLKNGSIVKGILLEFKPGESVKIKTADGNIFVFETDKIISMEKQPIKGSDDTNIIKPGTKPLGRIGISIQPLGMLQFGPILQVDVKIVQNLVLSPHIRWAGLGLISHAIVDYEELIIEDTWAFGGTAKYFFGRRRSNHKLYAGLMAEYGFGHGYSDVYYYDSYWDMWTTEYGSFDHEYFDIISNFGYRMRFNSGLFINFGILAGMAFEITDRQNYPVWEHYSNDVYFIGLLEVGIGWELW